MSDYLDVPSVDDALCDMMSHVDAFEENDTDDDFCESDFITGFELPFPARPILPKFISTSPYGPTVRPSDPDEGMKP